VAFSGGGPHFYLGSQFGGLEAGALLGRIVIRMADRQMDGPPERLQSNFFFRPKVMPVRFRPARPDPPPRPAPEHRPSRGVGSGRNRSRELADAPAP
jgi:hypothetical protein